jgi:hypothetical protein
MAWYRVVRGYNIAFMAWYRVVRGYNITLIKDV